MVRDLEMSTVLTNVIMRLSSGVSGDQRVLQESRRMVSLMPARCDRSRLHNSSSQPYQCRLASYRVAKCCANGPGMTSCPKIDEAAV